MKLFGVMKSPCSSFLNNHRLRTEFGFFFEICYNIINKYVDKYVGFLMLDALGALCDRFLKIFTKKEIEILLQIFSSGKGSENEKLHHSFLDFR
jgi:hypothetical protein